MSIQTQTVFVPFRYCPLCRLNHKKGTKHVHSKRHKDILAIVLSKFLKKISEAKDFLKNPAVQDLTWDQADKKFWCYFCQEDVKKHRQNTTTFGDCILEYGGLLEHITRSDHLENTTKFLKENKLDMKRTGEFIISEKVYLKYLEDIEAVYSQYFIQKIQTLKQVASQIRYQSMVRHDIVASSVREKILPQQPNTSGRETNWPKPAKDSFSSEDRGKKTIQAFGEGLTPIDRHDEDDNAGNIYTNAVPPWMQLDNNSTVSSGVIGPTLEDLEKHQKLERKRQLPACRVGAKFDRKSDQTDAWLPDFGGVWNHGRRTKSGHQFLRRQSKNTEVGMHVSSPGISCGPNSVSSFHKSSYSFQKMSKASATITNSSEKHRNSPHDECDMETPFVHTDAQSTNNNVYFSAPNVTQKSDFLYNQDLEDVKLQPLNSAAEMTSSVHSSSWPTSDFMNDSLVAVKPYVRKHRRVAATVSEQGLSSGSLCLPQMHESSYPPPVFNMNKRSNMFETQNSTNCEIMPPHFLPYENHISLLGYDRKQATNGVSYPVQKYIKSQSGRGLDVTSNISFRLISTPVLNEEKSKFPLKKSLETTRFEK